ncbi:MAG: lectin-like protein, partial [Verrucomicrobiota bacterium]
MNKQPMARKIKLRFAITFLLPALTTLVASQISAAILAGPFTNAANGHIYFLLSSNTWTGAEAEAVSLGGHLVTINDADENHWVFTNFVTFGGIQRPLWIGFYQPAGSVEPAGGWTWISGEPVTYTDWTPPGEPNNNTANGPQNWAMVWPPAAEGVVHPYTAEH